VAIVAGAASDRGRVRRNNEDSCAVLVADWRGAGLDGLLVVADGMGGHAAGEVASAMVVDCFEAWFEALRSSDSSAGPPDWGAIVRHLIQDANRQVHALAQADHERAGMGSTVVAALIARGRLYLGSVGDSRVYLVDGSDIFQLTRDHSWVAEEVRAGRLSARAAATHPHKNLLTRAVGVTEDVEVDGRTYDLLPGDHVLLCTDGLTNVVSDAEIASAVRAYRDPRRAAAMLVDLTLRRGAPDNVTVVIAGVDLPPAELQHDVSDDTLPGA
jgi:serine/threonine protein phosphatase PrpC